MAAIETDTPVQLQSDFTPQGRCLYRLSLEKYEAMIETGVFTKRDRFHLVEGLLVAKMTDNPQHSSVSVTTTEGLRLMLPAGWHIRGEKPLRIPDRASLPEPDITVARGRPKQYLTRHPEPADVGLVVEVADSSLLEDRTLMLRVYGGAGIVRYWIVNLIDNQVEVYSQPSGPDEPIGYRMCEVYRPGQEIPVWLDDVEIGRIAVSDILP